MKRQGYFAGAMIVLGCVAGVMRGGAQGAPPAAAPPPVREVVTAQQAVESYVRLLLRGANVKVQPATADALVAVVEQRRAAYEALRKAEKNVAQAVRANIAPAQLRVLLNEWNAVAQDERERRVVALQNFAAAADVPGDPRLESWLRLMGIMGDEEAFMDTPRQAIARQARTPQGLMSALGFDAPALQAAVIEHLQREQESQQPLLRLSIALNRVMGNGSATDAQVAAALREWTAAVQQDKERRAAAVQALDTRIGFSKDVRLAALLRLMGIVGDEVSLLNGDRIGFNAVGITSNISQRDFTAQLTEKPATG